MRFRERERGKEILKTKKYIFWNSLYILSSTTRHPFPNLVLHIFGPGGVAEPPVVLGALHVLASLELRFTI